MKMPAALKRVLDLDLQAKDVTTYRFDQIGAEEAARSKNPVLTAELIAVLMAMTALYNL